MTPRPVPPSALDRLDELLSEPTSPPVAPPVRPPSPPPGRRALLVAAGIVAAVALGFGLARLRPPAGTPVTAFPVLGTSGVAEASVPCDAIRRDGREWLVGPDRPTEYAEAQAWARALPNCGGGWRIPTSTELVALFDPGQTAGTGHVERGRAWPARINPAFAGIGGGSWVWSAGAASAGGAPAVNLNQGVAVWLPQDDGFSVRAFAVRDAR